MLVAHPGTELYGSDRVMLDTVAALVDRGWQVTVAVPGEGPLTDGLRDVGAVVRSCPTAVLRKSALRPRGMVSLLRDAARSLGPTWRLLRGGRPDVVYVSTVTAPLWLPLARLARRPVVCHVHEAEVGAARVVRTALAAPLLCARSIVANSEFSLRTLTDAIPRLARRSTVVPNPVPGPPVVSEARTELTPPVRLLFIGRLSPRKGPQVALEALRRLRADGVDAHLDLLGAVFTGYEWFERELRDAVRRDALEPHVEFLGFRNDVWPSIAASDVVLVPSVAAEPFGNTAVEAVLAARPVVASTAGGLVEAVRGYRSARSVPPDDPAALAAAVRELLDDWPTVRAGAAADAVEAADRHSPERYGERIERLLLAAVGHDREAAT